MDNADHSAPDHSSFPFRAEMEIRLKAKIVTYDDRGVEKPGGQCRCCGGGPVLKPTWRVEPWYVFNAGLCDADGVFYSMLCEGCLEEIRAESASRPESLRDILAREITHLLGEDLDGAQSMMDDRQ